MESGILHIIDEEFNSYMRNHISNLITNKNSQLSRALWAAGKVGYEIEDIGFVFLEPDNPQPQSPRNERFRLGLHIKDFDPGKATQFKLLLTGEKS